MKELRKFLVVITAVLSKRMANENFLANPIMGGHTRDYDFVIKQEYQHQQWFDCTCNLEKHAIQ